MEHDCGAPGSPAGQDEDQHLERVANCASSEYCWPSGLMVAIADDLLARMVNPHLADTIVRAARDPRRKLGWDDRLVGLIRMGMAEGVPTPRYAMGVAAGVDVLRRTGMAGTDVSLLTDIWPDDIDRDEAAAVLDAVDEGRELLLRWRSAGFDRLAAGQ